MPRPTVRRDRQAVAYLNDEDSARLDNVAAARGTTRSEIVRQMVRQGLDALERPAALTAAGHASGGNP